MQINKPSVLNEDLLIQVKNKLNLKSYSQRTKSVYLNWVKQFIMFHHDKPVKSIGLTEVEQFLAYLDTERHAAKATQSQALTAIMFFCQEILFIALPLADIVGKPLLTQQVLVVLTHYEVSVLLHEAIDAPEPIGLIIKLLYGAGLQLMEAVRLRVEDIDFQAKEIAVRNNKGHIDRKTVLPDSLVKPLKYQIEVRKRQHKKDIESDKGRAWILDEWKLSDMGDVNRFGLQYLFASKNHSLCQAIGFECRDHVEEKQVQRYVKRAAQSAGIAKNVSPKTLRHSFAVHALQFGYDLETVQKLLGHSELSTTRVYMQFLTKGRQIVSPLDMLQN